MQISSALSHNCPLAQLAPPSATRREFIAIDVLAVIRILCGSDRRERKLAFTETGVLELDERISWVAYDLGEAAQELEALVA
jgi:hypothetical protein